MNLHQLSKILQVHCDTLYKSKKNQYTSKKLAKKLEKETGIHRLIWLYPEEYGDPWKLYELEQKKQGLKNEKFHNQNTNRLKSTP
jgi:hypothetical protein